MFCKKKCFATSDRPKSLGYDQWVRFSHIVLYACMSKNGNKTGMRHTHAVIILEVTPALSNMLLHTALVHNALLQNKAACKLTECDADMTA